MTMTKEESAEYMRQYTTVKKDWTPAKKSWVKPWTKAPKRKPPNSHKAQQKNRLIKKEVNKRVEAEGNLVTKERAKEIIDSVVEDRRDMQFWWDLSKSYYRALLDEIVVRKRDYSITEFNYGQNPRKHFIEKQKELVEDYITREKNWYWQRYRLYYGWNGAAKTASWAYVTVCKALWYSTSKYNLPFLWTKKNIIIGTKSGANVKGVIAPYLIGDSSITRIPPDEIEKITMDNQILKSIVLKNGCKILIYTYDQGSENWQGGNPDFIWLDEEPTDADIFTEALARTRTSDCEMLITMTPLSWLTRVYEYFFENPDPQFDRYAKIYRVNSMDNPFTDKTWAKWLSDQEYRLRVEWVFDAPTWLVYNEFNRHLHVIPYFKPNANDFTFYCGVDFGVSHPTGIAFVAVDRDDNFYIFDEFCKSNALLEEIADFIREGDKKYWFKAIVRDSASKREWLELERRFGIRTTPADKHSKGSGDMSNRKTGILLINNEFHNSKILIGDNCPIIVRELSTHYYKDSARDWEVIKDNDQILDWFRYIATYIRHSSIFKTKLERGYNASKIASLGGTIAFRW